MIHPDIELKFINETIGYGVFARKKIPAGTITYIKDSLEIEISQDDFSKHPPAMQEVIDKYSYTDQYGTRVISWDIAKYVNHCCKANTMSTGWGFEIALRDIEAGEQVTDEYGLFNIEKEMPLFCKEKGCRRVIRPDDFEQYYQEWDSKIKKVLPALFSVKQPLMAFMDVETQKELQDFLHDSKKYKSVLSLKLEKESA